MNSSPSLHEIKVYRTLNLIPKRFNRGLANWNLTKGFCERAAQFELGDDGSLYFHKTGDTGVKIKIIEGSARESAFHRAHGAEHNNYHFICQQFEDKLYWPSMKKDIKKWIDSCKICQMAKRKSNLASAIVLTDHAYSCDSRLTVNEVLLQEAKSKPLENIEHRSSKEEYAIQQRESSATSKQISEAIRKGKWDHDYVADSLTQKRIFQAGQRDAVPLEQHKARAESRHFNELEGVRSHATFDEAWIHPVHLDIKLASTFLPSSYDTSFLKCLGLEQLIEVELSLQTGICSTNATQPSKICRNCETDFTPSWQKSMNNEIVCVACFKHARKQHRISQVKCDLNEQILQAKSKAYGNVQKVPHPKEPKRKYFEEQLITKSIANKRASSITLQLLKQKGVEFTFNKSVGSSCKQAVPSGLTLLKKMRILNLDRLKEAKRFGYGKSSNAEIKMAKRNKWEFEKMLTAQIDEVVSKLSKPRTSVLERHLRAPSSNTLRRIVQLIPSPRSRLLQPAQSDKMVSRKAVYYNQAARGYSKVFQRISQTEKHAEKRVIKTVKLKKWAKAKQTVP